MKTLNICFIGTGWMGSAQLGILAGLDGINISVVVERNCAAAEKLLEDIGLSGIPIVADYDAALDAYPIDAVWIVSPNSFHASQAIKAMQRGIHVFCEKPASTTFADYEKEIALTRSNRNLMTMVDYVLFFNPMEQALISLSEAGEFGRIHQIQVNYRHPVNISGDKVWKLSKQIMGDALGMGINHAVSSIVNIMHPQARPVAVYASSENSGVRGFEVDPVWSIMIRFDDDSTALCLGNIDVENGYDLFHCVAGSRGGFIFDSRLEIPDKIRLWFDDLTDGKWVYPLRKNFTSDKTLLQAFKPGMMLPDSGHVLDHQLKLAIKHFLDSVRTGKESPLSFNNSRIIAEIGWAAQVSAKTHREVALPISGTNRDIALSL
ncbi:MAG: Gfo/Idh/MocA family protein [Sphaerochaetaceae bacterium]